MNNSPNNHLPPFGNIGFTPYTMEDLFPPPKKSETEKFGNFGNFGNFSSPTVASPPEDATEKYLQRFGLKLLTDEEKALYASSEDGMEMWQRDKLPGPHYENLMRQYKETAKKKATTNTNYSSIPKPAQTTTFQQLYQQHLLQQQQNQQPQLQQLQQQLQLQQQQNQQQQQELRNLKRKNDQLEQNKEVIERLCQNLEQGDCEKEREFKKLKMEKENLEELLFSDDPHRCLTPWKIRSFVRSYSEEKFLSTWIKISRMSLRTEKEVAVISNADLVVGDSLGSGSFASVKKGKLGTTNVAIKQLHEHHKQHEHRKSQFRKEASLGFKLNHPNVVVTHGFCPTNFWIILGHEECSLYQLLNSQSYFTYESAISIASDVALGLAYANSVGILHRDLNTGNILFSRDGRAKISDFGEGREFISNENQSVTADKGSMEFRSPEGWTSYTDISKCDIWSFGVLLSKIASHRPVEEITHVPGTKISESELEWMKEKLTSETYKKVTRARDGCYNYLCKKMSGIYEIMVKCVRIIPDERISFLQVLVLLAGLRTETEIESGRRGIASIIPKIKK